jgi:pantoate--beta-alanine ligase
MGALHAGHTSLIKACRDTYDVCVVSIFVNPIQFNNEEDLEKYPRDIERDIEILENESVDFLYYPPEKELYPETPYIRINFGRMAEILEGEFRSGHFDGVGVVVSKLFNIIEPDGAFFGLKDLQQYLLIRKLVEELNFPVEVIGIETQRESSGLALSSRNERLSTKGKQIAASIHKGLVIAASLLNKQKSLHEIKLEVAKFYESVEGIELEYLKFLDVDTFEEIQEIVQSKELAICFAGFVEGVRLIDNLYLRPKAS